MCTNGPFVQELVPVDSMPANYEEDRCDIIAQYYYNRSDLYETENAVIYSQYFSAVCYPILLLLCTVGNFFNVKVLLKYPRRNAKETLLLCLALSDLLVMWFALPRYMNLHRSVLGIQVEPMEFLGITMGVFTWLQYTFQYVSDWLLVLFSLERLAGFRFPAQHHVWRTRTRSIAGAFCGLITLSALLTCETVPYYYINIWRPAVAKEDPSCSMSSGGQMMTPQWLNVWESVQHIVDMVLPILISGILFLLNTWLICHIKRHSWQEDDNGSTASDYISIRGSVSTKSTITRHTKICAKQAKTKINRMLLGAVCMYFITQLPVVLLNLIGLSLSHQPYCKFDFFIRPYLQPIIWTIALVNYSGNFLVYFGVSQTYRRIFHQLFTKKRISRPQRSTRPITPMAEWNALMQINKLTELGDLGAYNSTCNVRKPRNDSLSLGLKRRSAGDSQESLEHIVEGKSSKVRFSMEE